MSAADWWGTDGRSPRHFADALLVMRDDPDPERQRRFMETHVPEHLRDLVRDHYRTALALGGKE